MNRNRQEPADRGECRRRRRRSHDARTTFTHCVSCDYESRADFDVCPRCKSEGMAVLVLKKA